MASDKVNKLLALAKDQASTQGEKRNALEIAHKIDNKRITKRVDRITGLIEFFDNGYFIFLF